MRDGSVLVEAVAVGVCGTDVEIVEGKYGTAPRGKTRLVLGHESLGRVLDPGPSGALKKGDLVVEFDRQAPLREAIDKQAEWKQLEEDIRKKQAEMALQDAVDDTSIKTAENDLALARLETTKNDVLPRIDAEKNTLGLRAAEAKLPSLRKSVELKREAAAAELAILELKRDRAARVRDQAMARAEAMLVRAPIDGLVVPRTIWKPGGSGPGEPEEGDEVWPGMAVLDIVSPKAMRVRVKVNQVDVHRLVVGTPARITLDAYPERHYPGRLVQVSPIASRGAFSPKVRTFTAIFAIDAQHAEIAPDLSAAVGLLPKDGDRAAR